MCKGTLDICSLSRQSLQVGRRSKRDEIGRALLSHTRIVAAFVAGARKEEGLSYLTAIGACRTLADLVQESLQTLVDEARRKGHTWQEIGDVLGTTRQAAFQRFGHNEADS